MISPIYMLYGAFALAVCALLINVRVKLPKKIFLFLAVSILVLTCWVAMERPQISSSSAARSRSTDTTILRENVLLDPGINEIPLLFDEGDAACTGVVYSLFFAPEQGENFKKNSSSVSLLAKDGSVAKCAAFFFDGNALKTVFVFPPEFDCRKISFLRIVCGSDAPLYLTQIREEKNFN